VEETSAQNKILCISSRIGNKSVMSEEVNIDLKNASSCIACHVELPAWFIAIKEFCHQRQGGEQSCLIQSLQVH
jgi:hypothetical protein